MQMLTCKYYNIYCTEVAEPEACGVHLYTEGVEARLKSMMGWVLE